MTRFLLIDDEAQKGWEKVLIAVLKKEIDKEIVFESAINIEEAKNCLLHDWDLIFLDLRFGELDHSIINPEEFSGAQILKDLIRNKKFINFATPVITFTASRKIWNIDKMIDLGADSYFIKESPLQPLDESFSKANYERLIKEIRKLLHSGFTRKIFWKKTVDLISTFESTEIYPNIKKRIIEKLLIGYGLLSGTVREYERNNFLFAREVLAFVVYWSILEEISKGLYEKVWTDPRDYDWKIKDMDVYLVKKISERKVEIGIKKSRSKGNFADGENTTYFVEANPTIKIDDDDSQFRMWTDPRLSIRYQIIGLLVLKYKVPKEKVLEFEHLDEIRNKVDFIHSDAVVIMNETFEKNYNPDTSLEDCQKMFDFISYLIENM